MLSESQFRELVSGRWRGPFAVILRALLATAEVPYGWEVARRNRRFDRGLAKPAEFPVPIISVGNVTVGGTGKTPLVLWLARWLRQQGAEVTLISRGYGSRSSQPNDEALELAARLPDVPHVQNPDRAAAARQVLAAHDAQAGPPRQVLVLDDAFQHRRIDRDLDIVLLDALEPFGYGHLLPRGLLREQPEGLARAHVIALSRADAVDESRRQAIRSRAESLAPRAIWIELAHQPTALVSHLGQAQALSAWRGRRVAAFCGIGNPAGFRHTLDAGGFQVAALRELPDHFAYPPRAVADLEAWIRGFRGVEAVLCTRKDLVKLPRTELGGLPLLAVEVEVQISSGQKQLEERLHELLARKLPGR